MKLLNNVQTPWGPAGTDFEVEELDSTLAWHVEKGNLSQVVEGEDDLTPKQRAVLQAQELGVSTSGSQAQIEKRIADHLAEKAGDDEADG